MITIHSLDVNGIMFNGMQVELPHSRLLIIANELGYIMSTTFTVEFENQLKHEKLIAGTVANAQTVDDLLKAPLEIITEEAQKLGWKKGMPGKEALLKIT